MKGRGYILTTSRVIRISLCTVSMEFSWGNEWQRAFGFLFPKGKVCFVIYGPLEKKIRVRMRKVSEEE